MVPTAVVSIRRCLGVFKLDSNGMFLISGGFEDKVAIFIELCSSVCISDTEHRWICYRTVVLVQSLMEIIHLSLIHISEHTRPY